MERNHIIGFILIFATLLGWSILSAPSKEELEKRKQERDSIAQAQQIASDTLTKDAFQPEAPQPTAPVNDSLATLQNQYAYGPFATAASGTNQEVVLENEDVKLVIDTKGGKIKRAHLKKYLGVRLNENREEEKFPLELLNNPQDVFSYTLPVSTLPSGKVNTANLYFQPSKSGNKLSLKASVQGGGYIEQIYDLSEQGYDLDYDLNLVGLENVIDKDAESIQLDWKVRLNKLEKNAEFEQRYSTLYYKKSKKDNPSHCKCMGNDVDEVNDKQIDWVANTNQFFNATLISEETPFLSGKLETITTDLESSNYVKTTRSELLLPYAHGASQKYDMKMYVGPNEYKNLREYHNGLVQIIPYGNSIFGSINRHIIRPFFDWLSTFIGSKGIVILLMIFVVKMLLYPLMYKALKSQALMSALKPELSHLNDKYKNDPQQKQVETMKIYREYGVSPFGGCLPMLLQAPIWFALFRFFPASIRFRQEPFLWANDLSTYDDFFHLPFNIPFVGDHLSLFTILYAVSMIVYTYINSKNIDMSANPAMKYMQYFMPLMFFGIFNSYASGLTCYMFFSNLINTAQTVITKNFVFSDDKLRAQLQLKKAKPKKKNKFQERLEAAMKEQQAKQAEMNKKRKK